MDHWCKLVQPFCALISPLLSCGKATNSLPLTTQGCQQLPFAGRETWEKKEHIAVHYEAELQYSSNALALTCQHLI